MALNVVRNEYDESITDVPMAGRYGNKVNWGAIFAGAFVSLGFSSVFMLLGNACGLAAANIVDPTVVGGLKVGTFIYDLGTIMLSFGIGGYTTTRLAGIRPAMHGAMHGLTQWALGTTVALVIGMMSSPVFSQTIRGFGPDVANWLLFVTAISSAVTAMATGAAASRGSSVNTLPQVEVREGQRAA